MMTQPFPLWSVGRPSWLTAEAQLEAVRRLNGSNPHTTRESWATAELLPVIDDRLVEPAVDVAVIGIPVGQLRTIDATRYAPVLFDLLRRGCQPRVPCRIRLWWATHIEEGWFGRRHTERRLAARLWVGLDEPHRCAPVNDGPSQPYALLPPGRAVLVSGEEDLLSSIEPVLRPEGQGWAFATVTRRTGRSRLQVQINGEPIGELSVATSRNLAAAVDRAEQRGLITAARALITGSSLHAEVTLSVARGQQLPASWPTVVDISDGTPGPPLSAHAPIPPRPSSISFQAPPGWPEPPAGWEPPPGWAPSPTWPPAPPDWLYWVAT